MNLLDMGKCNHSTYLEMSSISTANRRLVRDFTDVWGFLRLVSSMESIALNELQEVALLNRLEMKYVLREADLYSALSELTSSYRVLDIYGIRLHRYISLYFDTPGFFLYYRHSAGGKHRYKIRTREYADTHLAFLEIKHKISRIRTIKNRVQTPELLTYLSSDVDGFIRENFPLEVDELEPKLVNAYHRITLVSKHNRERLTLDLNPRFYTGADDLALPRIAIAEVKYQNANRKSDFMRQMRKMGIRPMGFSKYCFGVSTLYPQVKNNRFRPTLRSVRKLLQGG